MTVKRPRSPTPPANDAAAAFDQLRSEVSLLHAAIEGLTAAKEKLPDYAPTLRKMEARLDRIDQWHAHIADKPALQITPAVMADEFGKRAVEVRAEDRRLIADMRGEIARAIGELDGQARAVASHVPRALSTQAQKERQIQVGVAGFIVGILLWSFLPGAIARSLPESWGVPQWMAERMIGNAARHEDAAMEPKPGG